jgi:hypothetical protein
VEIKMKMRIKYQNLLEASKQEEEGMSKSNTTDAMYYKTTQFLSLVRDVRPLHVPSDSLNKRKTAVVKKKSVLIANLFFP